MTRTVFVKQGRQFIEQQRECLPDCTLVTPDVCSCEYKYEPGVYTLADMTLGAGR